MKKHSKKSGSDAQTEAAVTALEGKIDSTLPSEWQKFAAFWQKKIEAPLRIQRRAAATLTKTALKLETDNKKKQDKNSGLENLAAIIREENPAGTDVIVEKTLSRLNAAGTKQGRLVSFPSRRVKLLTGSGILAAAAVALFVFLMRPQVHYTPAAPERMQAILHLLPEADEAMGLLEERDGDEVAAFSYGFHIELARNFQVDRHGAELAGALKRLAVNLQRRGFSGQAKACESLSAAARERTIAGIDLVKALNKVQAQLKEKWPVETDNWYSFGMAMARQLLRGYALGTWNEIEDKALEKVREQLGRSKTANPKTEKLRSDLRDIFSERKCDGSNHYCSEQKEKIENLMKETGIYRF